jgi:hypothetical protein
MILEQRSRRSRRGALVDNSDSVTPLPERLTRKKPNLSWADPKSGDWDVIRYLKSDDCLAPDPLLKLPGPNHTYLDRFGKLKDPHKYSPPPRHAKPVHPKLIAHFKNGTDTAPNRLYYQDLPPTKSLPIAGVIRSELPKSDPRYEGRTNFHGDPVPPEFLPYDPGSSISHLSTLIETLTCDYEDLTCVNQEENFQAKAMVKLLIPDHIKAMLVDDWENVTKNQQLVPLPATHSVNSILNDYLEYEKPKRAPGPDPDILEEVVAGLKEYFEKCLGRILLYR